MQLIHIHVQREKEKEKEKQRDDKPIQKRVCEVAVSVGVCLFNLMLLRMVRSVGIVTV